MEINIGISEKLAIGNLFVSMTIFKKCSELSIKRSYDKIKSIQG
jgi:hypothetical protein